MNQIESGVCCLQEGQKRQSLSNVSFYINNKISAFLSSPIQKKKKNQLQQKIISISPKDNRIPTKRDFYLAVKNKKMSSSNLQERITNQLKLKQ